MSERTTSLRFDAFELDVEACELRLDGAPVPMQPQTLTLLSYLVTHAGRVVPKGELLDAVWGDAHVTESSVERAVSLARRALGTQGAALIVTVPRRGYRFTGALRSARSTEAPTAFDTVVAERWPAPRYVRNGDVHLAYRVLGDGPHDVVLVNGWVFPMDAWCEEPSMWRHMQQLAAGRRVLLFDKRGTGLSDRVKRLPTLEQRMDDLRAVLDAAGMQCATVLGYSEGAPLSLMFAASFPERTRGLVLVGAFARMTAAPDYPWGWSDKARRDLGKYIETRWGSGSTVKAVVADRDDDPAWLAWASKTERSGAGPGAARDLLEMNCEIDVRSLLPSVRTATTIIHSEQDVMFDVGNARYLAEHVPGARLIELPGRNHMPVASGEDGAQVVFDALAQHADVAPEAGLRPNFLTTVVAVADGDAAAGTPGRLAEADARRVWGGGRFACFDGPARAIEAAAGVARGGAAVAVHTGEVHADEGGLAGSAVDVAAAMVRRAAPGSVRVSAIVVDLVPGSGLQFEPIDGSTDRRLRDSSGGGKDLSSG